MLNDFHEIPNQPDELLKEGLKAVDSRILKMALVPEPDAFISNLIRGMSKMMQMMFMEDMEVLKEENKLTPEQCTTAQNQVKDFFTEFLSKNGG